MGRIRLDDFAQEGEEVARVYLAASLEEAKRVEQVLDASGFEYAVEIEPFATLNVLGAAGRGRGAVFYVGQGELARSAHALTQAGLTAGLVDDLA